MRRTNPYSGTRRRPDRRRARPPVRSRRGEEGRKCVARSAPTRSRKPRAPFTRARLARRAAGFPKGLESARRHPAPAPPVRGGRRPPGSHCAARAGLDRRDLFWRRRPLQGLQAGPETRVLRAEDLRRRGRRRAQRIRGGRLRPQQTVVCAHQGDGESHVVEGVTLARDKERARNVPARAGTRRRAPQSRRADTLPRIRSARQQAVLPAQAPPVEARGCGLGRPAALPEPLRVPTQGEAGRRKMTQDRKGGSPPAHGRRAFPQLDVGFVSPMF